METLADLLGDSPRILAVRDQIKRLLQRQAESRRVPPILVQGETGTGKGLVARIIHAEGPRATGPFVDVNCAAIPATLLEAELFGFERGAFTDARQAKAGLFQVAHRGTIFLDEVGLLPEGLQVKLLKVIEEREVRRLGSTKSEAVDVAVLAATSEDLAAAIRARRFREDLYHRLAVVAIALPALRERGSDIALLAEHLLAAACADYSLPSKTLAPDARAALIAYPWPGNVRELANVVERVALLSEGVTVTAAMLALPEPSPAEPERLARADEPRPLAGALRTVERDQLVAALGETNWNITQAAARLGVSRNTLRYRLEKHGLVARPSRSAPSPARPAAPSPVPVAAAPAGERGAAAPAGERRQVTLLRAVLPPPAAGSASEASRAIEAFVEKAQSFGGRVEELSPSEIEASFGIDPVEDAPLRAAHAALAVLHAAARARAAGGPLPVRVAVHAAHLSLEPVGAVGRITPAERDAATTALETLLERAEPGTILVSREAAPFLERRFELVPVGLPGERPVAYRLAGRERPSLGGRRRLARFVGRQHELELLESRLASAMTGRGQVVGIAGEAGIGKTRLLFELRQRLAGRRVAYLEGHCLAYGSAMPYLPLLDLLRASCGIADLDAPEAIVEKVRATLSAVGLDADEAAPCLLQLLGMKEGTHSATILSPEAIKARTFETLRQMALRASRQQPLVVAIENLHWIDRTSEEYLASLVESLAGAPILLLLTYRPGYRPPGMEKSYATQVALQALAASDSLSLVQSFLAADELPADVTRVVLAKAEGNPFFLEELALGITEDGGESAATTPVPDTIQEALMARVDRLPDASRRVLQTASVLGREFSLRLLGALWQGPGGLDPHLVELKRLEFLYEQSGAEEPAWVFKHALTQEVAYESLPATRRRALHAAAARTLEALYAGRLAEVAERLAHHYARTDDSEKAVLYLTRAADKAAATYAHAEAVGALTEAARHGERLPVEAQARVALDLALRLARSLYFLGRFPESLDLLLRQRERVAELRDPRLAAAYHFWLGYTQSHLGDHAEADRCARRAIEVAETIGDEATAGKASYVLARGGFWSGRFREGVAHGRRAVALLARTDERWWLGAAHWGVAFNHGFLGEFPAALESVDRARAVGEALGDPRLLAYAAWTTGWIRAGLGEWDAAIEACTASLERSPDPVNTADALSFLGYAHVGRGAASVAIPLLERATAEWRRFRHRPMLGWFTAVLAEAFVLEGRADRAGDLAGEAVQLTRDAGFRYGVGVAERALGRIARAAGDLAGAARHLGAALETFAAIEARAEAAVTRLDCALVAHARSEGTVAARHLAEAWAAARALGLGRLEERAARRAAELGIPLPAAAPGSA